MAVHQDILNLYSQRSFRACTYWSKSAAKGVSRGWAFVHQPSAGATWMGDPGCFTWSLKPVPVSNTGTCLRLVICHTLFGLVLGILPYTCFTCLMPSLDSGCHVCFCQVGFAQTHSCWVRLCPAELQLSVKLLTFSMLLVIYLLQLVLTCEECNVTCLQFMCWTAQAYLQPSKPLCQSGQQIQPQFHPQTRRRQSGQLPTQSETSI